jgi:hypothetical protein
MACNMNPAAIRCVRARGFRGPSVIPVPRRPAPRHQDAGKHAKPGSREKKNGREPKTAAPVQRRGWGASDREILSPPACEFEFRASPSGSRLSVQGVSVVSQDIEQGMRLAVQQEQDVIALAKPVPAPPGYAPSARAVAIPARRSRWVMRRQALWAMVAPTSDAPRAFVAHRVEDVSPPSCCAAAS